MRLVRVVVSAVSAVAVTVAILTFGWGTVAYAGGGTGCQRQSDILDTCQIQVQQPQHPTDPNNPNQPVGNTGDSGPACYFDPTRQRLSGMKGHAVPCHTADGYWSNAYDCYISPMKPQPPANDPSWQGHQPGDGAVYNCTQPQTGMSVPIWAGSTPQGPGVQLTPLQVAQMAIKRMNLHAVGVGLAPTPTESNPKAMGVIGVPVWMWVDNPTATTYGPLTASASAGGITVAATAKVERVEWNMGDDSSPIDCGQGTPYNKSVDGTKHSPDCGYTYQQTSWDRPNHEYTVTASSYWKVDWHGAGQQGTIRLPALVSTVHVKEGELQVLNQG